MKKPLLAVLVGLFCSGLLSNPQAHAQISTNTNPNSETQSTYQVTARDYCDFLNQVAKSDSHFLYDEHLSSSPYAACIVRTGTPGHYEYGVIEGRENWPITFVSKTAKNAYLRFANNSQMTGCSLKEELPSPDDWVKSNVCEFEIFMSAKALSLSLSLPSPTLPSSSSLDDISAVAIAFALGAFGHELMMRPGGEALDENLNGGAERTELHDTANHQVQQIHEAHEMHGAAREEEQEDSDLSLHDFQQALAQHPEAARFIIVRDAAGKPSLQALGEEATRGKSRSENMLVTAALRTALDSEHPEVDVADLLSVHPMTSLSSYPSLSSNRLQAVFEKIRESLSADQVAHQAAKEPSKKKPSESNKATAHKEEIAKGGTAKDELQKKSLENELSEEALTKKIAEIETKITAAKNLSKEAKDRGDRTTMELYQQIEHALGGREDCPGAAYAYSQAVEEQKKGNPQAAESWRKSALAHEAQAEAYSKGDAAAAGLQFRAAFALGGHPGSPGAAYAYSQAAKEQKKGNTQVAEAYRKSALAYEAQAEALSKGDMVTAELQENAARAWGSNTYNSGVVYAYEQAADNQKKGNTQAASTWYKSALAYEACAEAFSKGKMEAAELQQEIARALGRGGYFLGVAYAYEQKYGDPQIAGIWRKSALAYEAQAEALSQGDRGAAEFQEQAARALGGNIYNPGAAYAYEQAAEQKKRNTQAAEAWRKSALAYEAQAEALSKGDMETAELQKKIARALGGDEKNPGAAYAYKQKYGDPQVAKAWSKSALACEAQAEALSKGDAAAAELQEKAARILVGNWDNFGAAYVYELAADEQKKRNYQAAKAYRKSALAYEAQAEAFSQGDMVAVELQKKVATTLGGEYTNPGAAYAYKQAADEQKEGHTQIAETWRKSALAYEAQAEALSKGDIEVAERQKQAALALVGNSKNLGAAYAYKQAANEQKKDNTYVAETWRKCALAYEACAEAFSKGDTTAGELQYQIATALGGDIWLNPGAAYAYQQAVDGQRKGNTYIIEAWCKTGLAYEAQAEALSKGDMEVAELQKQIAAALGGDWENPGAAYAYQQALDGQKEGHTQIAETWRKSALAYEAQAEALSKGDRDAAELQKQIATALGGGCQNLGAARAYQIAANEQKEGNTQVAETFRKSALAYEACVEALFQGDMVAAELQKQAGTALGGNVENLGATYAYKKAAEKPKQGNTQVAEIWQKCALAREAQAEALSKGYVVSAELQNQLARALGGDERNPGAAYAYSNASDERGNGNFRSAEVLFKEAQQHEARAESLAQEIREMATAPKGIEEYKIRATEAFEKTLEVFNRFVTVSNRARETNSASHLHSIENEIKKIKAEAKKILNHYDGPINQFPRILEKASASVTEEAPLTKAWFNEQLQAAKKIKTELHTALIESLDFGTAEHQAVFWTGYVDGNQTLAMLFSENNNKKTLEMTTGGRFLDDLNLYGRESTISIRLADDLFDLASERFARGARGKINAFLPNAEPRAHSVFKRIEEPILKNNPNIQLTWHIRPKYDYWRTVAQREEEKEIRLAFQEAARAQNHTESDWIHASSLLEQASDSLGLAFESTNKAIKTAHLDTAVALWKEAIAKASATQELWSQSLTSFEQVKEQIPEMLKTHLPRLLAHLNEEKVSWLAEIKWRELRHEAAIAEAQQEKIAALLASNNSTSLKRVLDDTAPIITTCEHVADEWKRSEEVVASSSEAAAQKEKEYNNLKNTVAFSRAKIEFSKAVAEVIAAYNKAANATGEKEKNSNKLREALEAYCDAIGGYQQFLQHVENNAPAEWNTTRGWNGIATDWEKNKKEVEVAQRKMALKTGSFGTKTEEDQSRGDHEGGDADFFQDTQSYDRKEKHEADLDEPTKWANFWKSFKEDNQPLVNQFSKEMNKLILDMTGGKRLPEITEPASAGVLEDTK